MAENIFYNNRLKFHTGSRVAISIAQSMMQATNMDGHTVTKDQIWTANTIDFPKNQIEYACSSNVVGATNNLISVFKNGNHYEVTHILTNDKYFLQGKKYYTKVVDQETISYQEAEIIVGNSIQSNTYYETIIANGLIGKVYRNNDYPAVELYQGVEMTDVQYSDKQAWQIKTADTRVIDWCSPTAVKNGVLPVPGYTGYAEASTANGETWTILQDSSNLNYGWNLADGNWQFVYMCGMLIFHPDYIPSKMNFERIRFTGFKYIGNYLSEDLGMNWIVME